MAGDSEAMRSSTMAPSEPRFVMYSGPRASRAAAITQSAAARMSHAGASVR